MTAPEDIRILMGEMDHLRITPALTRWLLQGHEADWDTPALALTMGPLIVGKEPRVQQAFHPSSLWECPRKQMFSYLGVPGDDTADSRLRMIFLDGHWRHLKWQTMLLKAGIITHPEVAVVDQQARFVGSIDGVNEDEHWGLEIKGTWTIPKEPKHEHVMQIHGYMWARPDLTHFNVIYENKQSQEFREFRVDRNPELIEEIDDRLIYLNNCANLKELPSVISPCAKATGPVWQKCPYRNLCHASTWATAETAAARGPVHPFVGLPAQPGGDPAGA